MTLPSAGVGAFRETIADYADNLLGPDDLKPRLRIDGCLGFRDINGDFAGEMAMLAPFGTGNPRPLFEARGVEVVDGPRRLKDKHLKMALKQNGRIFRAIAWRAVEREQFITENRASLDFAFSLEHNRYQGNEYLELSVSDVRAARAAADAARDSVEGRDWACSGRSARACSCWPSPWASSRSSFSRHGDGKSRLRPRRSNAATLRRPSKAPAHSSCRSKASARRFASRPRNSTPIPTAAHGSSTSKVTSVRQGKTFIATGDEARVGENQTNLDMKGNVVMTSSDGLEAKAGSATYNQGEGIVRAPGPVTFKRGRMSGSGVDFSYDETRDLMGLSDQTKVRLAPEKKGGDVTDITAGAAVLARTDKFVSFERAVHIVRGSQVIDARQRARRSQRGRRAPDRPRTAGRTRASKRRTRSRAISKLMSGDVINLTYYENTDLLQSAIVTGGAALRIAAEKDSDGKRAPRRQHRDRHGAGRHDAHVAECAGPRRVRSVGGQRAAGEESDVERARGERRRRERV